MNNSTRKVHRSGFTLLEILIVVTIIAILTTLSVTVMLNIDQQANEAATVSTLRKIDAILQDRIEGFEKAFERGGNFRERYEDAVTKLLAQKGIFGVREEVIRIMAKKVAFRHNFPQQHSDLLVLGFGRGGNKDASVTDFRDQNTDGFIDWDEVADGNDRSLDTNRTINGQQLKRNLIADVLELTATDPNLVHPQPPEPSDLPDGVRPDDSWYLDSTVSAELLYYTVVHGPRFGTPAVAEDQFTVSEVTDADEDGFPEFVDSWGNPLRFYRWPTKLVDPDVPSPFLPDLVLQDPTDVFRSFQQVKLDGAGNPETNPDGSVVMETIVLGTRRVTPPERLIANLLFKGLPPAPGVLPNSSLPRDLLLVDPDDPIGRIYAEMELLDGSNGKPNLADEFNELWYHSPETYHSPLIVSAGDDGLLGLYEPTDFMIDTDNDGVRDLVVSGNLGSYPRDANGDPPPAVIDALSDNLTNRNSRAGGRR